MIYREISAEVRAASEHVPFGNSAFQVATFTGGLEGGTSERRVRALLLNLDAKLLALEEAQHRRAELGIDLEEIAVKIEAQTADNDPHGFERRRLVLQRDYKTAGLSREDKLIRDALAEIEAMHGEWKALPPVTSREQFEAAEPGYWARRLWADVQREVVAHGAPLPGTLAALNQMGLSVGRAGNDWRVTGPATLIAALAPPASAAVQIGETRNGH